MRLLFFASFFAATLNAALFAQSPQNVTTGSVNAVYEAYRRAYSLAEYGFRLANEQRSWGGRTRQPCSWNDSSNIYSVGNGSCFVQIFIQQAAQTDDDVLKKFGSELVALQRIFVANAQIFPKHTLVPKNKEDVKILERVEKDQLNQIQGSALRDIQVKLEEIYKYLKTKL